MSVEAMIKCDRCSERLLVTSAANARSEAMARGWKVAPKGTQTNKRDFCSDCARWMRAEKSAS